MKKWREIQFNTEKQKAKNLIPKKKFREAFTILTKLKSINSQDVEVLTGLADCYSEFGQYDKALLHLDQAIRIDPQYILALIYKCEILGELGKYQEGIDLLEKEIRSGLNDPEAYSVLGELYQVGDIDYNAAIDAYNKALGFPNIVNSRRVEINLANCYYTLGFYSDAIKIYDKLISNNQTNFVGMLNKAVVLEEIGDLVESLRLFKQIVNIYPDSTLAWNYLADLYDKIDAHDKAKECRDKAEDIELRDAQR